MKNIFRKGRSLCFGATLLNVVLFAGISALQAQQPMNAGVEQGRHAMRKLAFLVGNWSGPVTIVRGRGEPLHLTQTERISYKLDGLVLLIEGKSTDSAGKAEFKALATVAIDEHTGAYRIRAYNDGHYVDAPLTVTSHGFSWGFAAGPAQIENTMHLTAKGDWHETTHVTFGSRPPFPSVDMLLKHRS